jgi:uncharacterized protein YndB with AHSA1/START domain
MADANKTGVHPGDKPFTITRVLDAPRDLVWRVYTEEKHLKHWWGPKGFKMLKCTMDLRPGGIFHYGMQAPDGSTMWGKWTIREIVKPERLSVVVAFSDENGGITQHPFSPHWPRETLAISNFADSGGKTTIALAWYALNASEIERQTFDAGHASMTMGFAGTFEQLTDYLKTAQ